MENRTVSSGVYALDEVVQSLRLGDNVVWQVDYLSDYIELVQPFIAQSLEDGRKCVYIRFASHEPVVADMSQVELVEIDPSPGFDYFSREVHKIIEERGLYVFYVFDNLSELVSEWATDELLGNFFQVTCPFLFELDTVAYFALQRGKHQHSVVARIRDTTQILIDIYHADGEKYFHPLKVWDRYSPQMFLPHVMKTDQWKPVSQSGQAADVSLKGLTGPFSDFAGSIAPWDLVYQKLRMFSDIDEDTLKFNPELSALKSEFCRMLLGSHPVFSELADKYFTLEDLFRIRNRLVGSGRIGGKAAGMLFARRVLLAHEESEEVDLGSFLEAHDSFYIGSDVFFTFLVENDLFRLRLQLTKNSDISQEEFEEVEERFLAGKFPDVIMEQFKNMLDYFGQAPVIVRSSSLLEDSFGNAFAGKYRSEFCANQGGPQERLDEFVKAVKLVYASALNRDALTYRRKRGLGENDEQMAILVQRVCGMPYKGYFFPQIAGVAFSKNLYAWSNRIDPEQGILRMVFGLGTRAVDRVGGDYPRMIAVSNPLLRPETGRKIAKYSQQQADVLDLESNSLVTKHVAELLKDKDYSNLHLCVSILEHDHLKDPVSRHLDAESHEYVLTFNNLVKRTDFVKTMGHILEKLERAYGHPVDTEFTASIDEDGKVRINLLQCRPLWIPGADTMVELPEDLVREKVLFEADRMINGGTVDDIRYVVYIDCNKYHSIKDENTKKSLGRLVGRINALAEDAHWNIIMIGPGRWGSSNIDLGVNVGYADIDNTAMLIEMAREESGQVPEVSYGTHFFLDLVESQIVYLPVYPDDENNYFNDDFFESAHNSLSEALPADAGYEDIVKLIDLGKVGDGAMARAVVDAQRRKAVCYIT